MANNPHSPKFKAYLARRRRERRAAQEARARAGGDWRDGNPLTGEGHHHYGPWDQGQPGPVPQEYRPVDLRDRSVVDWSDVDASGEYDSAN